MSKTSARDAFASLGLTDESAWTKAMNLAVTQKWTDLPTGEKVDDLRAARAAVKEAEVPEAAVLVATGVCADLEAAGVERKRLVRNAKVNAWRERNKLQAALDARDLKFAAMRAKRTAQPAVSAA
jgi:hypothetical protein